MEILLLAVRGILPITATPICSEVIWTALGKNGRCILRIYPRNRHGTGGKTMIPGRLLWTAVGSVVLLGSCGWSTGPVRGAADPPLGSAPANCTQGAAPRPVPTLELSAIGAAPIWAVGFHPEAPLHVDTHANIKPTPHGWPWKIPWVEHRNYTGAVTIRAWTLPRRQPVWFSSHTQGPRQFLRIDPSHPTLYPPIPDPNHPGKVLPNPDWKGFSSIMYILRASCYMLEVQWSGGSWRTSFAAGS
jgi:hypothetical protein